jgi:hypothetical protein
MYYSFLFCKEVILFLILCGTTSLQQSESREIYRDVFPEAVTSKATPTCQVHHTWKFSAR